MKLRFGKTKNILSSAIDAALLAVEVYNKPRASFRTQNYISLMVMAWTRLFHAYFNREIGDRYYYKKMGTNRYEMVDGERKTWELRACVKKYGDLPESVSTNLDLFIKLRNKIEHRHVEKHELDMLIFGECQALLYNFETLLIELFGQEYAISENLTYSLQFSTLRTTEQTKASKRFISTDMADIKTYVENYRSLLPQDIFDSSEYSIKLLQIPKIANASRNDLAVEFVNWSSLSEDDRKAFKKLGALVKDKVVKHEVVNLDGLKPGRVLTMVEEKSGVKLSFHDHNCLLTIFSIKPGKYSEKSPSETNTKYCHYDQVHYDFIYHEGWVDCICEILKADKMKKYMWQNAYRMDRRYELDAYL